MAFPANSRFEPTGPRRPGGLADAGPAGGEGFGAALDHDAGGAPGLGPKRGDVRGGSTWKISSGGSRPAN